MSHFSSSTSHQAVVPGVKERRKQKQPKQPKTKTKTNRADAENYPNPHLTVTAARAANNDHSFADFGQRKSFKRTQNTRHIGFKGRKRCRFGWSNASFYMVF